MQLRAKKKSCLYVESSTNFSIIANTIRQFVLSNEIFYYLHLCCHSVIAESLYYRGRFPDYDIGGESTRLAHA